MAFLQRTSVSSGQRRFSSNELEPEEFPSIFELSFDLLSYKKPSRTNSIILANLERDLNDTSNDKNTNEEDFELLENIELLLLTNTPICFDVGNDVDEEVGDGDDDSDELVEILDESETCDNLKLLDKGLESSGKMSIVVTNSDSLAPIEHQLSLLSVMTIPTQTFSN